MGIKRWLYKTIKGLYNKMSLKNKVVEDLKKAAWYLNREIERRKENGAEMVYRQN